MQKRGVFSIRGVRRRARLQARRQARRAGAVALCLGLGACGYFTEPEYQPPCPRAAVMAGGAISRTCKILAERLGIIGAHLLQCGRDEVEVRDGKVVGPRGEVSIADVASIWYLNPDQLPDDADPGGLEATGGYKPKVDTGSFTYSAHAAVVAVEATSAPQTSPIPWNAASLGSLTLSRQVSMLSSETMELSSTMPIAKVMPARETTFTERPSSTMPSAVPKTQMGIERLTRKLAPALRRKRKSTRMAKPAPLAKQP